MKKIVYLLFACMAVFACKDEESGPGYTVPTVNEAPDFTDVDGKVYNVSKSATRFGWQKTWQEDCR